MVSKVAKIHFFSSGVNLLIGADSGLMLLDRSGQGKVYPLISRRRFQQLDVLEGLNLAVTISGTFNITQLFCFISRLIIVVDAQAKRTSFASII